MARTAFLILALLLSGCAVIETYDARGALTERRVGVMPVGVVDTADAAAVRVRGAGALYARGSAVLGYGEVLVIRPPTECSAVVIVDDAEEARRWAKMAAEINGLCNGGSNEDPF